MRKSFFFLFFFSPGPYGKVVVVFGDGKDQLSGDFVGSRTVFICFNSRNKKSVPIHLGLETICHCEKTSILSF